MICIVLIDQGPNPTPEQQAARQRVIDEAKAIGVPILSRFTDAGSKYDPEAPPPKKIDTAALVAQWEAEDAAEAAEAAKKAAEEQGTSRE